MGALGRRMALCSLQSGLKVPQATLALGHCRHHQLEALIQLSSLSKRCFAFLAKLVNLCMNPAQLILKVEPDSTPHGLFMSKPCHALLQRCATSLGFFHFRVQCGPLTLDLLQGSVSQAGQPLFEVKLSSLVSKVFGLGLARRSLCNLNSIITLLHVSQDPAQALASISQRVRFLNDLRDPSLPLPQLCIEPLAALTLASVLDLGLLNIHLHLCEALPQRGDDR
mmetsp:Transcript_44485/g.112661  ORF Transcript_44485/g.112661 Transcript_44485/m.112661 type:complete len:224 (-) Transcript_44485:377-1048(-)